MIQSAPEAAQGDADDGGDSHMFQRSIDECAYCPDEVLILAFSHSVQDTA